LSVAYPDLKINLCIKQNGQETPYEFKYSFEDFVKLFDTESSVFIDKKANIRLAVCHNKISENFEHFQNINGADTFRGGTFIDCLKETFASNLREKIKKEYKLDVTNSDICKNVLIIHFQTWNAPQFEGQTKEKFVNDKKEVQAFVNQIFTPRKTTSIVNNLPGLKEYIKDFVILKNDRKDMMELKKVQKNIGRQKIPKLISASSNNRMECSIYITEGDSAISNLAMVRNSRTMAGIPLRGKVLNVYEMNAKDIVSNKEIQSLMNAIGLQVGEKATPRTLNYGKIIIATDQDMDGYCIRCLIVNFLYKYWPELFEHERVHILESPLYEVINNKSKDTQYFYNKADFMEFMKNKNASSFEIAYFKGLGSCGKEAWDYMINIAPHMIKITDIGKSKESLKLAFGEDSDNRKEWLK
jgi:DNA gyrase subunit B